MGLLVIDFKALFVPRQQALTRLLILYSAILGVEL